MDTLSDLFHTQQQHGRLSYTEQLRGGTREAATRSTRQRGPVPGSAVAGVTCTRGSTCVLGCWAWIPAPRAGASHGALGRGGRRGLRAFMTASGLGASSESGSLGPVPVPHRVAGGWHPLRIRSPAWRGDARGLSANHDAGLQGVRGWGPSAPPPVAKPEAGGIPKARPAGCFQPPEGPDPVPGAPTAGQGPGFPRALS